MKETEIEVVEGMDKKCGGMKSRRVYNESRDVLTGEESGSSDNYS